MYIISIKYNRKRKPDACDKDEHKLYKRLNQYKVNVYCRIRKQAFPRAVNLIIDDKSIAPQPIQQEIQLIPQSEPESEPNKDTTVQ